MVESPNRTPSFKSDHMVGESSSSSTIRRRSKMKPPLILCPDCRSRRVVELKSTMPWSKDRIFYTYPNHKRDGTGCPFWYWEEDYVKYLMERDEDEGQVIERDAHRLMEQGNGGEMSAVIGLMRSLLVVGKEIAWLLKALVVVCVLGAFVLVLLLVVVVNKS